MATRGLIWRIYESHQGPTPLGGGEVIAADKWSYPWSEPVRFKRDPKATIALIASGNWFVGAEPFGENILESEWHYPWSGPVRTRPGLGAHLQPFASFVNPTPQQDENEARWHYPWSEPVRTRPGLSAAEQQFLFYPSLPILRDISWFAPFSDPVRQKIGLAAFLQQFDSLQTPVVPPPSTLLLGFNWWSEPVREMPGLKTQLQAFLFAPPRLLPTPDVTATMAATETNEDVALFGVYVYNPATPSTAGPAIRTSVIEIPQDRGSVASIEES